MHDVIKQIKDRIVTLKLTGDLLSRIDLDTESEGLSRSAIIRRILLAHYRKSKNKAA